MVKYVLKRLIERPVPWEPNVDSLHVFGGYENFSEQCRKLMYSFI